jgi:uncharacterized damage-inducible protein DinB
MDKEEALSRFYHSRQSLLKAIAGLSDDELTIIEVEGIWTIKDLLGHIAAWENSLLEPLSVFVDGEPFEAEEIPNHDAWNAEQSALRATRNYSEILKEIGNTRQELIKTAGRLTENQWNQTFRAPWGDQNTLIEMISGLAWHEEEHTKSILEKFSK